MPKEKPSAEKMQKLLDAWMSNEDNNLQRLISATKLKEIARAMDPDIRLDAGTHGALCREVALLLMKALQRCYDNKRLTIRPLDL